MVKAILSAIILVCLVVLVYGGPSDPTKINSNGWLNLHESFVKKSKSNPRIPILFYGDSITRGWTAGGGNGNSAFAKYYAKLGVENYAIGGDATENLLWRIQDREIQGLSPKLIVLMIGTNNLDKTTDDTSIVNGIKKIVQTFRQYSPNTKILILGILPRNGAKFYPRIQSINKQLGNFADGRKIYFLDMFNNFTTKTVGIVPKELFTDGKHLSQRGYERWAQIMNPLFNQLRA